MAMVVLMFTASLSLFAFVSLEEYQDSLDCYFDSVFYHSSRLYAPPVQYKLTSDDYVRVAEELGVEVAAIRAVVEIETGKSHSGFYSQCEPIINFDRKVFRSRIAKAGVSLSGHGKEYAQIMADAPGLSHKERNMRRLRLAEGIDERIAIESTFWGMFQIGGFNWKKCGAESAHQFAYLMSRSEHDQLELFARFLVNSDLVKYLKAKNWSAFARHYNGPGYRSRGYHTRLAASYRRHSQGK